MSDDAPASSTAPVEQTEQPAAPSSGDAPTATTEIAPDATPAKSPSEEASKDSAQDGPVPQTNGASSAKKEKRKSIGGGVPEHKNKKLNRKQSKIDLNLDVKPGELWLAVMKGYKNWPCIICDEEMLPESLLSKRPVSAMRPDGSYRADFETGAKNARDRRYPIMFLGTNEFAWHVNTDLRAITPEDCKKTLEEHMKKPLQPKTLQNAFEVASEGHDLAYFKQMLAEHEEQAIAAHQAWEEEERQKAEAAAKKDEDVEMADADGEKPKKEKKRKAPKEEEVGEDGKPLKTPKKIKIKPPQDKETPAADSASKPKKEKKKKEEKVAPKEEPKPAPVETPEEAHEKMQKTILFLRHRLQKGFLSRDKPPEESEMPGMHTHMKTLENYSDLDGSIIKSTKINKVLKAIIKLGTIPRESEFQFKKRSQDILTSWGKQLDEAAGTPAAAPTPTTNGVKDDEKEKPADSTATPTETPAPASEAPKKDETPVDAPAPAAEEKKPEEPAAPVEPTVA